MAAIVDVLEILEALQVTKEVLESTRLGKTVNEFRRRVNNAHLARRAKDLVKKWREQVLSPDLPSQSQPSQPSVASSPVNGNAFLVSEGPGPGPGATTISSINGKANKHPPTPSLDESSVSSPPVPKEHPHSDIPSISSYGVNGTIIPIWDGTLQPVSSRTQFGSLGESNDSSVPAPESPILPNSPLVMTASLDSPGSNGPASNEPPSLPQRGRGRKRKRKAVTMEDKLADVTSLLKGQIAKANELRSGIRIPPSTTAALLDDQRSSSSPDGGYSLSATLSPDDQLIKNDLVEKYLKSQLELKSQMERQYQDRLARNEFQESVSLTEEDAETNSSANSVVLAGDVTDAASGVSINSAKDRPKLSVRKGFKSSARKRKKSVPQGEEGNDLDAEVQFETEDEILSKLPPIDPSLLTEFADFVFDTSSSAVEVPPAPTNANSTNLTERLNDPSAAESINPSTPLSESRNKIFDFGDSDEDDEDFIEVKTPEVSTKQMEVEASPAASVPEEGVEEIPLREVDESEVTRLHEDQITNLNGNFDKAGTFREWHETVVVESYAAEDFLILPYCVIDF